jgi:hypothetical protein
MRYKKSRPFPEERKRAELSTDESSELSRPKRERERERERCNNHARHHAGQVPALLQFSYERREKAGICPVMKGWQEQLKDLRPATAEKTCQACPPRGQTLRQPERKEKKRKSLRKACAAQPRHLLSSVTSSVYVPV